MPLQLGRLAGTCGVSGRNQQLLLLELELPHAASCCRMFCEVRARCVAVLWRERGAAGAHNGRAEGPDSCWRCVPRAWCLPGSG
jgi:hypothetical protein